MQIDLIALIGVVGGWSGAIMGLAVELHRRRTGLFERLRDEITEVAETARKEHLALGRQVQDTNLTIAEHYVRNERFESEVRDIGRGIARIDGKVDRLYEARWRPRDSDGG